MSSVSHNEMFRNNFAARLMGILPADQLTDVLKAFDLTSADYDIVRKTVELSVVGGMPDIVKYYIAAKAVRNLSQNTLEQYTYKLVDFFKTVRKSYADITTNDIRIYLYNYKTMRNASDRYIDCIRIVLHGFFEWIRLNNYIDKNPCELVEKVHFQPKEREPLTPYELEVVRYNTRNIREKALIDFLYSTGCRVSECTEMEKADIDWEKRSAIVRHGKGDKERFVYFNAECEVTLRKYLESRTDDNPALFVSTYKPFNKLEAPAIQKTMKKIGDRCGIHLHPHRLRHTFATSGIRGGIPLEKLQVLLGHSKPETTLIYAKLDQTDIQMAHQRVYA